MTERVIQLVPAASGWRVVYALTGARGEDLEALPDEDLYFVYPVACFVLFEDEDHEQYVGHVTPNDWPSYLWIATHETRSARVGYLGPGEEPDAGFRKLAIEIISDDRARRATQAVQR